MKCDGATFGPNLNDDFILVHWTKLPSFERLISCMVAGALLRRKIPLVA
jgi:hypothetical protein